MDIYESRYFKINKMLMSCVGLWPYGDKKKNFCIRVYTFISLAIMAVPQVLVLRTQFGVDMSRFLESIAVLMWIFVMFLKVSTTAIAEAKFKVMYEDIANNWKTIKEENQRNILVEYSERGRILTIAYIVYVLISGFCYIMLPLTPAILNKLKPLNESRAYIFILNGEFLIDRDENFWMIYLFDIITCSTTVIVIIAVDPLYAVCTEHCIGLFAIVKYRLQIPNKLVIDEYCSGSEKRDESYEWMIGTIQMHTKILKFRNTIETAYSFYFMLFMGMNVLYFAILSVLTLINFGRPVNLVRYGALMAGCVVHLFYITWPGQKLIDHSTGLFRDAYCNEWYEGSVKSKQLLRFFTLRCSEPCLLTAGGLVTMNFETFMGVLSKSASYITVMSSSA